MTIDSNGDARVAVHVDDDGPGIPPDQRANVVRRSCASTKGAVANKAARRSRAGRGHRCRDLGHGGELSITDSPLGGARVTIALPTARS